MIPSEKGKGASKPTVNFMQGQLLVRRLHNGLKKRGAVVSQTKWSSDCYKMKRKSGVRERESKENGFKNVNAFKFLYGAPSF